MSKPPRNAKSKTATKPGPKAQPSVPTFLRQLEHPLKREIASVRRIILGISPDIVEEIKWNAPSFRTTGFFATFHLHKAQDVRLILHLGAKVNTGAAKAKRIQDPSGLLHWLGKDRALVTFDDAADLRAKRAALEAIIREWIQLLPPPPNE